jgi:hypothetical protein
MRVMIGFDKRFMMDYPSSGSGPVVVMDNDVAGDWGRDGAKKWDWKEYMRHFRTLVGT